MALLDNIAVFYDLNEASGAAIDSVGGLNLSDNNTVGMAAGIGGSGAARDFDGTNQFLSQVSSTAVQTGDIDFSLGVWVYLDSLAQSPMLIAKDIDTPGSARDYTLEYSFGNGFRFYINGAVGGLIVVSPASISATTWYYVAAGHSAALDEIWISATPSGGGSVASPTTTATSGTAPDNSASSPFHLGSRAYSGFESYLDGRLQYAGLWKRDIRDGVASAGSDLTALYNGGAGLDYTGMGGGGGPAGQPTTKRFGGVPHTGTMKFRGGHRGGVW